MFTRSIGVITSPFKCLSSSKHSPTRRSSNSSLTVLLANHCSNKSKWQASISVASLTWCTMICRYTDIICHSKAHFIPHQFSLSLNAGCCASSLVEILNGLSLVYLASYVIFPYFQPKKCTQTVKRTIFRA